MNRRNLEAARSERRHGSSGAGAPESMSLKFGYFRTEVWNGWM
jgi:hypothetical protein